MKNEIETSSIIGEYDENIPKSIEEQIKIRLFDKDYFLNATSLGLHWKQEDGTTVNIDLKGKTRRS